MQRVLLAVVFVFTQPVRAEKCASRCDVSLCPSPSCLGGYVLDRCNCCLVCSPRDGDPCGRKNDLPCGDGLECRWPLRLQAGRRGRGSAGACRCKTQHRVCGSDGKTYSNVCKMRAASRKAVNKGREAVIQAHKGPCAPQGAGRIPSPRYKFNFIADVVEKIAPAVVHIELFVRHPLLGRHMRLSSGSGFVVTPSGVIVTNAHVVTTAESASGRPQLRVQLHDGDAYEAAVRDVDSKADIATVKINPQKKLHVLSLGRSAELRPGEFVVAIGSPFALQNTVTTGIVSTAQRDGKELGIKDSDMDYIQTDAIINYGNSGGPLVNLDGEVIGINTLKVTAGISFAIPSDRISRFLSESQIKHSKDGRFHHAFVFVSEASDVRRYFLVYKKLNLVAELKHHKPDFPDVSSGVLVQQVIPDTPAESGGIKEGDVITKLNGRLVGTTADVHEVLKSDRPLLIQIRRGNEDLLFNIHPQLLQH
uniref:HtrA serine peptidase 3a n=1 Tax=Salarias fasciatus TaxID=181472 RepID=A0A672GFE9_SALFA